MTATVVSTQAVPEGNLVILRGGWSPSASASFFALLPPDAYVLSAFASRSSTNSVCEPMGFQLAPFFGGGPAAGAGEIPGGRAAARAPISGPPGPPWSQSSPVPLGLSVLPGDAPTAAAVTVTAGVICSTLPSLPGVVGGYTTETGELFLQLSDGGTVATGSTTQNPVSSAAIDPLTGELSVTLSSGATVSAGPAVGAAGAGTVAAAVYSGSLVLTLADGSLVDTGASG